MISGGQNRKVQNLAEKGPSLFEIRHDFSEEAQSATSQEDSPVQASNNVMIPVPRKSLSPIQEIVSTGALATFKPRLAVTNIASSSCWFDPFGAMQLPLTYIPGLVEMPSRPAPPASAPSKDPAKHPTQPPSLRTSGCGPCSTATPSSRIRTRHSRCWSRCSGTVCQSRAGRRSCTG